MFRENVKAKTAAKKITFDQDELKNMVLKTVSIASKIVGDTLGPNGKLVLIERQENLPVYLTKDGITVFNSISFQNSTMQAILEAARDSSSKTNDAAGDGTTTATILAEALIRNGFNYIQANPHISVQKVMRELEGAFDQVIVPFIRDNATKITFDNADDLLTKVATIATNSDTQMAEAVIEAFNLVGHNGNITIEETSGVSGFQVEKIDGFHVGKGLEESCGRFVEDFINDRGNLRTVLDKPKFLLINGKLNEPSSLVPVLQRVVRAAGLLDGDDTSRTEAFSPNIVVVAHGFSDAVLAFFSQNFKNPETINILPLKTPITQQTNSPQHFLYDLAAYTGAEIFDPVTRPVENALIENLGIPTMTRFEMGRHKSMLFGEPDEMLVIARAEELEQQVKQPESQLDKELTQERLGLLTGGIARVKVLGSSESELKEKRHRVEDAVCAIKGALREGVLPGCAKTLLTLSHALNESSEIPEAVKLILGSSLVIPFNRILENGGYNEAEINKVKANLLNGKKSFFYTYNALNHKYGNAIDIGVLDSASAVYESIKNSLGVAKMLMGLSSTIVFQRDSEEEIFEAKNYNDMRQSIQEAAARRKQEDFHPSSY
jgi:chaperonin GroEL